MKRSELEYKDIELPNKLRAVLISSRNLDDDDSQKLVSAACLTVGVGSFADSPDLPGQAHATEHSSFNGNETFPDRSDFDRFIQSNNGSINGQTLDDTTSYECSIKTDQFDGLMQHLSCMIFEPLFRRVDVRHEEKMMDAELSLRRRDVKLLHDHILSTATAKENSPWGKFKWGSQRSLSTWHGREGEHLAAAVREFHHRYYRPENMTLAVVSSRELSEMEEIVKKYFNRMPYKQQIDEQTGRERPERNTESPVDPEKFHKFLQITAPNFSHNLVLSWALPPSLQTSPQPLEFIGFVLGHRGRGSLLSNLIKTRLACDVTVNEANPEVNSSGVTLFGVTVSMTPQGVEKMLDILTLVFQCLLLIKGLNKAEVKKLYEQKVREEYEELNVVEHVGDVSYAMQIHKDLEFLKTDKKEIDFSEFCHCLDLLTPELMNVTLISPTVVGTIIDKWFRAKYLIDNIPQDWLAVIKSVVKSSLLGLPQESSYSIRSVKIKSSPNQKSRMRVFQVKSEAGFPYTLYHHSDSSYDTSAHINMCVTREDITLSPERAALLDTYVTILNLLLLEESYEAANDTLQTKIESDSNGLVLKFSGESGPLKKYVTNVVQTINNIDVDENLFDMAKSLQLIDYKNQLGDPDYLCEARLKDKIVHSEYQIDDKLQRLSILNLSDLKRYLFDIQSASNLVFMALGNFTESQALRLSDQVSHRLQIISSPRDKDVMLSNPRKDSFVQFGSENINKCYAESNLFPGDENSVVRNFYHKMNHCDCRKCFKDYLLYVANVHIWCKILGTYDEMILRGEYGVGYTVDTSVYNKSLEVSGAVVTAYSQETRFSAEMIGLYIDSFVLEVQELIATQLTEERFKHFREIASQMFPVGTVDDDAVNSWAEIVRGRNDFTSTRRLQNIIKKAKLTAFQPWISEFFPVISRDIILSRKVSMQIVGDNAYNEEYDDDDDDKLIVDDETNNSNDSDDKDDDDDKRYAFFADPTPAVIFSGKAVVGKSVKTISLKDYAFKYVLMCFYPTMSSPICQQDLQEFNSQMAAFTELDAVLIVCTTESIPTCIFWCVQVEGVESLEYPVLSDSTLAISKEYGVLQKKEAMSCKALFVINREGMVKYARRSYSEEDSLSAVALKIVTQLKKEEEEDPGV